MYGSVRRFGQNENEQNGLRGQFREQQLAVAACPVSKSTGLG